MMADTLPRDAGKLTADAPLAPLVWFKSGGTAEWLFEPKDLADLQAFLRDLDPAVPVMALGLGSNMIVRDGGVPGVVVRLGKALPRSKNDLTLDCGGGPAASRILHRARRRVAGWNSSIPGTVGGFVRMNGGAYGSEVKDILVDCDVVLRSGELLTLRVDVLQYTYRHSELPEGAIVIAARFRGRPGEPAAIQAEMDRIASSREASPLRSRTGGRPESPGKGLGTGRSGRVPGADAGRRASEREAHQLPDQHRHRHQHRDRGAGRRSAAPGAGERGRGTRMGNQRVGVKRLRDLPKLHIAVLMGGWSSERPSADDGEGVAALESGATATRSIWAATLRSGWQRLRPTWCSTRCMACRARMAPCRA
jgi:UDP-N-acetylmuramate dehydrogenase